MSSLLTVSQLNRYVGFKLKQDIKLRGIAVTGEISNLAAHYRSGHIYFTLKDETSALRVVMFSSNVEGLRFMPKEGMKVVALGNIECYERDGVYQLVCTTMTPTGEGNEAERLRQLKEKLAAMGVFDEKNKKNLPQKPAKIGVVTSVGGAALRDIISVIKRRYPIAHVMVSPTLVQGEDAPKLISEAISRADNKDCDVIILARGGGSNEDLAAFNTEQVVMAVHNCNTPIVSAVGHETDTSLSDYAADYRAPTPSAAAEISVPQMENVVGVLAGYDYRMRTACLSRVNMHKYKLESFSSTLERNSPKLRVSSEMTKLDSMRRSMSAAVAQKLRSCCNELTSEYARLDALNPLNVLSRGFSVVTDKNGRVVDKYRLSVGDDVNIKTKDMEITAKVSSVTVNNNEK